MSSRVHIREVNFLNNPAPYTEGFNVEIIFEVVEDLSGDLEWELIYVGDPASEDGDQVLESVVVGPIKEGRHKFTLEASAPDSTKISQDDIRGCTVLILTCKYQDEKFVKVGYYVSVDYTEEELRETPPEPVDISKLERCVKINDVRVSHFAIKWADEEASEVLQQPEEEDIAMEE
ncbi:hypothetical protein L596_030935 [Steinernema carpocapsae]|uniref:Uncharacterized protein n=1 Tax=Steinernema carpocapsae TaxID=34508 RepID=A0A4U5MHB6_STECR|nr:hypothetical protein L596_030935 [Steinernema carpocapsae]